MEKEILNEILRKLRLADAALDREKHSAHQSGPEDSGDQASRLLDAARQTNFGVGMALIGIFVMCLSLLIPAGERWFAVICAVVSLFIGILAIDRGGNFFKTSLKSAPQRYALDGMSEQNIRLLVANRILCADGQLDVSLPREKMLFYLGWLFVALCAVSFVLTTALIWFSPMGIGLKFFLTVGTIVIFIFGGYFMSCYTIKPFLLIQKYLTD